MAAENLGREKARNPRRPGRMQRLALALGAGVLAAGVALPVAACGAGGGGKAEAAVIDVTTPITGCDPITQALVDQGNKEGFTPVGEAELLLRGWLERPAAGKDAGGGFANVHASPASAANDLAETYTASDDDSDQLTIVGTAFDPAHCAWTGITVYFSYSNTDYPVWPQGYTAPAMPTASDVMKMVERQTGPTPTALGVWNFPLTQEQFDNRFGLAA